MMRELKKATGSNQLPKPSATKDMTTKCLVTDMQNLSIHPRFHELWMPADKVHQTTYLQ